MGGHHVWSYWSYPINHLDNPTLAHGVIMSRVGVMISQRGSWRETVAFYASHKNLIAQCTLRYDDLVSDGMAEPWAALKALDEHCCADLIVDSQTHQINKILGRGIH